jgi:hypothetical protein
MCKRRRAPPARVGLGSRDRGQFGAKCDAVELPDAYGFIEAQQLIRQSLRS